MFLFIGYFSINTLLVYFIVIYGRLYRIFLSERARVFKSVQIIVRNNYVVKTRIINTFAQNVAVLNLKLYTNLTHPSLNFRFPTMIPDLDTATTFRKTRKFSNCIISDFITTNQQIWEKFARTIIIDLFPKQHLSSHLSPPRYDAVASSC